MDDTHLPPAADRQNRRRIRCIHWLLGVAVLLAASACQPSGITPAPTAPAPTAPAPTASVADKPVASTPLPAPPAAAPQPSSVSAAPCPFTLAGEREGEAYACGILTVPQFRDDPEGAQVGIFYAQVKAVTPDPAAPPLLVLAGGPGASGVYDAPFLARELAALRETRDLLFFDIRGSGFSQPRIDCAALPDAASGPACMDALRARGIEPMAFNTTQNAADAADLIAALGYAQADLLGISYGTRLALEMMRSRPTVVRAAVLDSVVAPETLTYELQAIGDYETRLWPFTDCEEHPACLGRFGSIAGRYLALINRIDEKGVQLTVDGQKLTAGELYNLTGLASNRPDLMALMPLIVDELDRDVTATYEKVLDQEFGDVRHAPAPSFYAFEQAIPRLDAYLRTLPDAEANALRAGLAALADTTYATPNTLWHGAEDDGATPPGQDGDGERLLAFLAEKLPDASAAELALIVSKMTPYERSRMLAAYGADVALYDHTGFGDIKTIIDCQEEWPFVDPETIHQNQAVIPIPSLLPPFSFAEIVLGEQRRCLAMGIDAAPVAFKDAVTSDLPVLMLSGTQDTVTPSLWARLAAESLGDARIVSFLAFGHALVYSNGACAAELAAGFLDDPSRALDESCVPHVEYVLEQPLRVALTGRMWRLQGWAGEAAGSLPATALFSRGQVVGLGGCSAYSGNFELDGDKLSITGINASDDVCTDDARIQQNAFLEALSQAQSLDIRGNRLLVSTAGGDMLVFALESDLPLEGPVWSLLTAASGPAGAPAPALSGATVTARFENGAVKGGLGCNLYEATYELAKGLALRDLQRVGDARCAQPAGVMEQEDALLDLWSQVVDYRVAGRELFLYDETLELLMVLYAAGE